MDNPFEARAAFSGLLRAFQSNAIDGDELLTKLDALLSRGASPSVLREVLERREYVGRLPDPIRALVLIRLKHPAVAEFTALGDAISAPRLRPSEDVDPGGIAETGSDDEFPDDITTPVELLQTRLPNGPPIREDVESKHLLSKRSRIGTVGLIVGLLLGIVVSWTAFRSLPVNTVLHSSPPTGAETISPARSEHTVDATPVGAVIWDCSDCPEMKVLPAGHYEQGAATTDIAASTFEKPQHPVDITHRIAVSINDVTVGQYRAFVTATGHKSTGCAIYRVVWAYDPRASWEHPGFKQDSSYPVTCVSWDDANAYTSWISVLSGHRYRLPTAAEWEYAARAGGNAGQPWGTDTKEACSYANVADQSAEHQYPGWDAFACNDSYVTTAPVGSFKANSFGLYDVLGNVLQWTADCWGNYSEAASNGSARNAPNCTERELRGSSWFTSPRQVRVSARNHFDAGYRTSSVGFRVARDVGLDVEPVRTTASPHRPIRAIQGVPRLNSDSAVNVR